MPRHGRSSLFRVFLGTAAAFVALNGVLYAAQGLLKRDDVRRAERMEIRMDSLRSEIGAAAARVEDRSRIFAARDSAAAHALERRVRSAAPVRTVNRRRPSAPTPGAPLVRSGGWTERGYRDALNQQRDAALAELEAEVQARDAMVAWYNELVDDYPGIAEAAYSRWWLLPVPAPRRAVQPAAPIVPQPPV